MTAKPTCNERDRLWHEYWNARARFFEAKNQKAAPAALREAHRKMEAARLAMSGHIESHKCG